MKKYRMGTIVNTHALKGEVKVYPHTDDIGRFDEVDYLVVGDTEEKLYIERSRYQKNMVYLKFKGKDRIEDVQKYLQKEVFADENNLRELDENEYMVDSLIGLAVCLEDGEPIGVIKDILSYPANDIMVIETKDRKECMIPFVDEFVPVVDLEEGRVIITPIEGMIGE